MRIAIGALVKAREGRLDMLYRYDAQSGTYLLLGWMWRQFGLDPMTAFFAGTAVAVGVIITVTARFVAREAGVPGTQAALAMLLLPELFALAYFPNSNVLAAAPAFLALLLLAPGRSLPWAALAGALLGLAIWMRFDAVLLLPSATLLALRSPAAARVLALLLATTGLVVTAAMWLSDARIENIAAAYGSHLPPGRRELLLINASVLTGLVLALAALGTLRLARRRAFAEWGPLAAGALPTLLVYAPALTTPKYLLYALPFLTVLLVQGMRQFLALPSGPRAAVGTGLVALFLLQHAPIPALATRTAIDTDDGKRYVVGNALLSWRWYRRKQRFAERRGAVHAAVARYLAGHDAGLLVLDDPLFHMEVVHHLLTAGFLVETRAEERAGDRLRLRRGSELVTVLRNGVPGAPLSSGRLAAAAGPVAGLYVGVACQRELRGWNIVDYQRLDGTEIALFRRSVIPPETPPLPAG